MIKTEKATYSLVALNEGLTQLQEVRLTARLKACYYPIFDSLKSICEWLEDYGGNKHAFYCCRLVEFSLYFPLFHLISLLYTCASIFSIGSIYKVTQVYLYNMYTCVILPQMI
mgnify:CR=1 FL=1